MNFVDLHEFWLVRRGFSPQKVLVRPRWFRLVRKGFRQPAWVFVSPVGLDYCASVWVSPRVIWLVLV